MSGDTPDPKAELEQDIRETRQRLGETVEALSQKADIPQRVKDKAHEAGAKVDQVTGEVLGKLPPAAQEKAAGVVAYARSRPVPVAVVLLVLVLLVRRLRRSS